MLGMRVDGGAQRLRMSVVLALPLACFAAAEARVSLAQPAPAGPTGSGGPPTSAGSRYTGLSAYSTLQPTLRPVERIAAAVPVTAPATVPAVAPPQASPAAVFFLLRLRRRPLSLPPEKSPALQRHLTTGPFDSLSEARLAAAVQINTLA